MILYPKLGFKKYINPQHSFGFLTKSTWGHIGKAKHVKFYSQLAKVVPSPTGTMNTFRDYTYMWTVVPLGDSICPICDHPMWFYHADQTYVCHPCRTCVSVDVYHTQSMN